MLFNLYFGKKLKLKTCILKKPKNLTMPKLNIYIKVVLKL